MKQKIKEAIETTLVVENKQSIDLCVDKIFNSIQEQKQSEWISVDDRLPEEDNSKDVCIDNNKLFMIYWSKHKSYEFAYLTRQDSALIWCIPDHGFAELSEVTYWKPLSLIPNK